MNIAIIGAGIAGLCAAVYARRCGYDVEVLEQHTSPGGLATSWKRGDYTFETCLEWLVGSRPGTAVHSLWREVFDIDALTFVDREEFLRLEDGRGDRLRIFTDVDRLEHELLACAPADERAVREFTGAIRRLRRFAMPDPAATWQTRLAQLAGAGTALPAMWRFGRQTGRDYGARFTHPLLRAFFTEAGTPEMSVVALMVALGWMNDRNAGYPIGGSQAVIRGVAARLDTLGGRVRYNADVSGIVVENDTAVGVRLADGDVVRADWVISAADGHTTIYDWLSGMYAGRSIDAAYNARPIFPSYLQVSLGIARDLSAQPHALLRVLDEPLQIDPETRTRILSLRTHDDPTFTPAGKTAVTSFFPTRNVGYWTGLHRTDPARYQAEKDRVAESVIAALEEDVPEIGGSIEVVDVSTPATVIHYTRNWNGSMEGWLISPQTGLRPVPQTLPGLRRFVMAGQWTGFGGGLPSGLMTARSALQKICRADRHSFLAPAARAHGVTTLPSIAR